MNMVAPRTCGRSVAGKPMGPGGWTLYDEALHNDHCWIWKMSKVSQNFSSTKEESLQHPDPDNIAAPRLSSGRLNVI